MCFYVLIKKAEVCDFADHTTIYSYSLNYEEAHQKLLGDTHIVPNWFLSYSQVPNKREDAYYFFDFFSTSPLEVY